MKISKVLGVAAAAAVAATVAALPSSAEGTYHAYLGVQTNPSWIFRNAWNDASFGKDVYENFNSLSQDGAPAEISGTFTDVEITGDGTYKVSLTGADLSAEEKFSLLFVSTDIPLDAGISITDVNVIIDGQKKYTFDEAYLNPDEQTYMSPTAINIWNDDLGKEDGLFGYVMPSDSVEMEFTISGMGDAAAASDGAAEETAAEDTAAEDTAAEETADAPASDDTTTAAATGNLSAAALAAVAAAAGAAAVLSKKRK